MAVWATWASMGFSRCEACTHASFGREVERKLSNLVAHFPPLGSSCDAVTPPSPRAVISRSSAAGRALGAADPPRLHGLSRWTRLHRAGARRPHIWQRTIGECRGVSQVFAV